MSEFYDEGKVYLDVRPDGRMTEREREALARAQLDQLAGTEAWSACGTNSQLAYATHGIFRYFGKFPPPVASHLIRTYTGEGDLVLDLMSGSGTTGVEALLENRRSYLNDVNPLSNLLARVKTTRIEERVLREALERMEQAYRPLSREEYDFIPVGLKNYEHWFLPETVDSLRGIRYLTEQIGETKVREFFSACFAAVVRRVSRATTQQGRLFLDVETAEKEAFPFFKKKALAAIAAVSRLPEREWGTEVVSYDLREPLPDSITEAADLVILHPPYFNSYKYSSINSLELSWLGFPYREVSGSEVREFFKVGKEENAEKYAVDMVEVLHNCHRALKPGSRLALMIGDTVIHGNYIPVTRAILDQLDSDLYEVELVTLRVPKYTEASWAASQRRQTAQVGITLNDFIIILRRKVL